MNTLRPVTRPRKTHKIHLKRADIRLFLFEANMWESVPVKLIVHKWLYIYLDQLSTTSNIVDGAPSTLLAIIPASPIKGIINTTPSPPYVQKTRSRAYISIEPARVR